MLGELSSPFWCVDQAGDEPPHPLEPLLCSSGVSWQKSRVWSRVIAPCPFVSVSSLTGGPQGRWTAEEGGLAGFDQETFVIQTMTFIIVCHSVSSGSVTGPALEGLVLWRVTSSQPRHPGHERVCQALGHLHVAVGPPVAKDAL